jgi:hypothetical protein
MHTLPGPAIIQTLVQRRTMISLLISTAIHLLFWIGLMWLILALLAARWRSWKPVYEGYITLLRVLLVGTARWLWTPGLEREGGGQIAQPHISFQGEEKLWD